MVTKMSILVWAWNLMIVRSYVDAVSCFKMFCNSGDQLEYPLSHRVYVYEEVCEI